MLIQICKDFPGLPDVRTLKASEIKFFYESTAADYKRGESG